MAHTGTTVRVEGLTKHFGEITAVQDLSFTAGPGVITGFLGPNGSGKTTTLRCLLGLVRPTRGRAAIGGLPYAQLTDPLRVAGASLEASNFHPARSGRAHLRIQCRTAGIPQSRVDDVLELTGLTDAANRATRGYSMGMRQRLNLAAALLGDPAVLILDEPSNGLDPAGIAWLRGFLRELADEGRTVLVSSHILSEVQQTVDRVVIVYQGRRVAEGTLDELDPEGEGLEQVFLRLTSDNPAESVMGTPRRETR